jgi:hypothetical protein
MQANAPSTDSQSHSVRRRSLFLPGFVLGFVMLTALSCGGGLYAIGLDTGAIAELRGQSAAGWTPPPTPISLPTEEQPGVVDGNPAGDFTFVSGNRARNITSSLVNVRSSPGYLGKAANDVVTQVVPGEQVKIVDGPRIADRMTWWYVQLLSPSDSTEGWIAEATASGVQILGE